MEDLDNKSKASPDSNLGSRAAHLEPDDGTLTRGRQPSQYIAPQLSMPHTSRRPRSSKPTKRAIVEQEDGWSRVEHGYGAGRRRSDSTGSIVRDYMQPADPDLTVEKMRKEHENIKSQWMRSEHCKSIVEALQRTGPEQWNVREAVCVALGPLSLNWHKRWRSVYQFCYFRAILDILKAKNKHEKIDVFVQEPRFTTLDHEFFKSMDIIVLENPAAESHIGDHTFFFGPCMDWKTEIPYLQNGATAPLYITTSASWIYDAAQRYKESENEDPTMRLKAMDAADTLRKNHHAINFCDNDDIDIHDSLGFNLYVLTDYEPQDKDGFSVKDLAASVEALKV